MFCYLTFTDLHCLQIDGQIWIYWKRLECKKEIGSTLKAAVSIKTKQNGSISKNCGFLKRKSTVFTDYKRDRIHAFLEDQPTTYTRLVSQQFSNYKSSLQRLTKVMRVRTYKIQMSQPLKKGEEGTVRWKNFANHKVEELEKGYMGEHKIWFSVETHFQLNGYLN